MSNYKIRVNSKSESKEAQQLFFELGYNWFKKGYVEVKTPETIMSFENGALSTGIRGSINHKEITLPELRDLVVLKRNDVNDRNVTDPEPEYSANLYLDSKGDLFVFHNPTQTWKESNLNGMDSFYKVLKPITKEPVMKEYLNKLTDGTYKLVVLSDVIDGHDGLIEIPDGAETLNYFDDKENLFFLKSIGEDTMFSNDLNDWEWKEWGDIDFDGVVCLWSRHTHPEELPFIDDECYTNKSDGVFSLPKSKPCDISKWVEIRGDSPNSQYAEIEKVRQSAWKKQEGGSHYKNLKIQPMQYALENKLDYAQANVVKYVTRHKEKNGKEDLLKAIHNIELMIEFYYGDEK